MGITTHTLHSAKMDMLLAKDNQQLVIEYNADTRESTIIFPEGASIGVIRNDMTRHQDLSNISQRLLLHETNPLALKLTETTLKETLDLLRTHRFIRDTQVEECLAAALEPALPVVAQNELAHEGPIVKQKFFCAELADAKISDAAKMQIVKYAHVYANLGAYYGNGHSEMQNRFNILGNREDMLREALHAAGEKIPARDLERLIKAEIDFLIDQPHISEEITTFVKG